MVQHMPCILAIRRSCRHCLRPTLCLWSTAIFWSLLPSPATGATSLWRTRLATIITYVISCVKCTRANGSQRVSVRADRLQCFTVRSTRTMWMARCRMLLHSTSRLKTDVTNPSSIRQVLLRSVPESRSSRWRLSSAVLHWNPCLQTIAHAKAIPSVCLSAKSLTWLCLSTPLRFGNGVMMWHRFLLSQLPTVPTTSI